MTLFSAAWAFALLCRRSRRESHKETVGFCYHPPALTRPLCFIQYAIIEQMGKLDEVKEILNTLRVAMSIAFGMLVILAGSLVKRFDAGRIDYIFWIGTVLVFAILASIVLIVKKISIKTKEIKDL